MDNGGREPDALDGEVNGGGKKRHQKKGLKGSRISRPFGKRGLDITERKDRKIRGHGKDRDGIKYH